MCSFKTLLLVNGDLICEKLHSLPSANLQVLLNMKIYKLVALDTFRLLNEN